MSDEEKKAIKDLIDSNNLSLIGDGTIITSRETIETILNLIEKQSKEIEANKGYHLGFIDGGIAKRYEYEDKIKAKIEEVDYKMIAHQDVREAVKQVLQSLLEKE